jgi:hypothetical protein
VEGKLTEHLAVKTEFDAHTASEGELLAWMRGEIPSEVEEPTETSVEGRRPFMALGSSTPAQAQALRDNLSKEPARRAGECRVGSVASSPLLLRSPGKREVGAQHRFGTWFA